MIKCRLCRREGIKMFLKGSRCFSAKCPLDRRGAVIPGFHGVKAKRKLSDFGLQLREKQKAKRVYEIMERQFHRYFDMATKVKEATGEALLKILESRMDNIVYRLGFIGDRTSARQLISHGHILLNGKKNNIPSTLLKIGDIIGLNTKGLNMISVKKSLADKTVPPSWLEKKGALGKVVSLPKREDIDIDINEQLIVEFYSR